jgi:hypothetical protein
MNYISLRNKRRSFYSAVLAIKSSSFEFLFCLQDDMVWIFDLSTPRLKFQILEIEEDAGFYKNFSKPYTRFCKNNEERKRHLTLEME